MSSYKLNPVTKEELLKWSTNSLVNPRTNRKIKKFSSTYNYLDKHFKKMEKNLGKKSPPRSPKLNKNDVLKIIKSYQGPAKGDHLKSFDNKDPISQEDIWLVSEENVKTKSDEIPSHLLFSYLDSEKKIRCFNIESIITLIDSNNLKHPITGLEIDAKTVEKAKKMFLILKENNLIEEIQDTRSEEKKLSDYAFSVCQKFSLISIFVEHQWFLNLNEEDIDKLYYESSDFFLQNVSPENKKIMVPPSGNAFTKTVKEFKQMNFIDKRKFILECINKVISSSEDEGMRNLGCYLMIGGLGVVCKEIRDKYPDFIYGFNI